MRGGPSAGRVAVAMRATKGIRRRGAQLLIVAALALVMLGGLAATADAWVYWGEAAGNTIGRADQFGGEIDNQFVIKLALHRKTQCRSQRSVPSSKRDGRAQRTCNLKPSQRKLKSSALSSEQASCRDRTVFKPDAANIRATHAMC